MVLGRNSFVVVVFLFAFIFPIFSLSIVFSCASPWSRDYTSLLYGGSSFSLLRRSLFAFWASFFLPLFSVAFLYSARLQSIYTHLFFLELFFHFEAPSARWNSRPFLHHQSTLLHIFLSSILPSPASIFCCPRPPFFFSFWLPFHRSPQYFSLACTGNLPMDGAHKMIHTSPLCGLRLVIFTNFITDNDSHHPPLFRPPHLHINAKTNQVIS